MPSALARNLIDSGESRRPRRSAVESAAMLIPESALPAYTIIHVAISLAAIASGFVVVFGMISNKPLNGWTALFLATTVATSVTGFGFPIKGVTPGIVLGVISLIVLAPVIYARYAQKLGG